MMKQWNDTTSSINYIYQGFFHCHNTQCHAEFWKMFPSSGDIKITSKQINPHKTNTTRLMWNHCQKIYIIQWHHSLHVQQSMCGINDKCDTTNNTVHSKMKKSKRKKEHSTRTVIYIRWSVSVNEHTKWNTRTYNKLNFTGHKETVTVTYSMLYWTYLYLYVQLLKSCICS